MNYRNFLQLLAVDEQEIFVSDDGKLPDSVPLPYMVIIQKFQKSHLLHKTQKDVGLRNHFFVKYISLLVIAMKCIHRYCIAFSSQWPTNLLIAPPFQEPFLKQNHYEVFIRTLLPPSLFRYRLLC